MQQMRISRLIWSTIAAFSVTARAPAESSLSA
jgi:hypothetical protein